MPVKPTAGRSPWPRFLVAAVVLVAVAVGSGVGLQALSRELLDREPAERAGEMRRLRADRTARDLAAQQEQALAVPVRPVPQLERGNGPRVRGGSEGVERLWQQYPVAVESDP